MRRGTAVLAALAVALLVALLVGPSGSSARPLHVIYSGHYVSLAGTSSAAAVSSPSLPSPSSSTPSSKPLPLPKGPVRAYVWADNTSLRNNVAITLVHGATPRQALKLIASANTDEYSLGTPIESAKKAFRWALGGPSDGSSYRDLVAAASLPHGWTLLCGFYGTYAIDDSPLAHLSRDGTSITLFEDINFDTQFTYARQGKVVREFDPFDHSPRVGKRLPQEKGIPFNGKWPMADSLYLAQLLSGVHLAEAEVAPGTSPGRAHWLGVGLKG